MEELCGAVDLKIGTRILGIDANPVIGGIEHDIGFGSLPPEAFCRFLHESPG